MAIEKSDLYSSLWASCDELRGGMDASQYKDYVLFMLFIKHVSDKYGDSDDFAPPVTIPKGTRFKDMVAAPVKTTRVQSEGGSKNLGSDEEASCRKEEDCRGSGGYRVSSIRPMRAL